MHSSADGDRDFADGIPLLAQKFDALSGVNSVQFDFYTSVLLPTVWLGGRDAVVIITEIPRRINSTNIFTSKCGDFDNLILSLASFLQCASFIGIRFHKIGHLKRFFLVGFKSQQPSDKLRIISLTEAREFASPY